MSVTSPILSIVILVERTTGSDRLLPVGDVRNCRNAPFNSDSRSQLKTKKMSTKRVNIIDAQKAVSIVTIVAMSGMLISCIAQALLANVAAAIRLVHPHL